MKRTQIALVTLVLAAAACSGSPTAPSAASVSPPASASITTTADAPPLPNAPAPVTTPSPAPPAVAVDPPSVATCVDRGLNFDYRNRNTVVVYNNTCRTVVLRLYVNELSDKPKETYSSFEATIEPGKAGYFSVSKPACRRAQFDWEYISGIEVRWVYSHGNPHNAGGPDNIWQATEATCDPPPATPVCTVNCTPPPPPPPPPCVPEPAGPWSKWMALNAARPNECEKKTWTRTRPMTCNAPPAKETVFACEPPQ